MDGPVTHQDIAELLGAYALDAVDPEEARLVAEHLAGCPRCAAELDRHRGAAALLANQGGDAPGELWGRISARLQVPSGADVAAPRIVPAMTVGDGAARHDAGDRRSGDAPRPPRPPRRAPAAGAWRRPVRWAMPAAAALAAAAAVVIALLAVQVGRLDGRVGQLSALAARQGIPALAEQALANPDAQRVALLDTSARGRTVADLVILPSGAAFLVESSLPALPAGRTYQLWGVVGGQAISLGLLGRSPTVVALSLDASAGVTRYAVTAEPAGGVVEATHPPVAEGSVQGA